MKCLHGDHCFHCGIPMSDTDRQCNDLECGTEANVLPPWPLDMCREPSCNRPAMLINWSWLIPDKASLIFFGVIAIMTLISGVTYHYVAAIKRIIVRLSLGFSSVPPIAFALVVAMLIAYSCFRMIKPAKMIRIMWQPIIGVELFIIGIFFLSNQLSHIGAAFVIAWVADRFAYQYIRHLKSKAISLKEIRDELRNKFRANKMDKDIGGEDEAENTKIVKDAGDKVKGVDFGIGFSRAGRALIALTLALYVLSAALTWGPGKVLSRANVIGWINKTFCLTISTVKNSKIVQDSSKMINSNQMKYEVAYNKLRHWLSQDQIKELLTVSTDYDRIIKLADKSDKIGAELLNELKAKLSVPSPVTPRKICSVFTPEPKSYFQELREHLWGFFFPVVLLSYIADMLLFISLVLMGFLHWIYSITDEWADKLKLHISKTMEHFKKKDAEAAGVPYVAPPESELSLLTKISVVDLFWDFVLAILKRTKLLQNIG